MIEGQPSRTAERVAMRRAAHQLLDHPPVHADPLALTILGAEQADALRADPRRFDESPAEPYLRAFLAVRSRLAEDALARAVDAGARQYVVLGAGLDTFAYRNPYPGLRVVEVDQPATQAWKRRRLAEAGIPVPGGVAFAAVDFACEPLAAALERTGVRRDEPTFFSWLGVTPYLEPADVLATLAAIAPFAAGGEWVERGGDEGGERREEGERRRKAENGEGSEGGGGGASSPGSGDFVTGGGQVGGRSGQGGGEDGEGRSGEGWEGGGSGYAGGGDGGDAGRTGSGSVKRDGRDKGTEKAMKGDEGGDGESGGSKGGSGKGGEGSKGGEEGGRGKESATGMKGGGGVVFDYVVPPSSLNPFRRAAVEALARRVAAVGEPFRGYFDPRDLVATVRGMGFRFVRDVTPDELNATYFADRSDGLRVGGAAHILFAHA